MAFEIKRNDRRPYFRVQLTENGDPADLSTAVAARLIMKSGTTVKINKQPMTFIDKPTGIVQYAWADGDTDTTGTYNVEVEVDWGGAPAEFQTFPSAGYFTVDITDDLA
jgi:hypothetical protein